MAITTEFEASIRIVDTSASYPTWGPSLTKSVTTVEKSVNTATLATAGTLNVAFGSVAAAKVLAIKVSAGPVTITVTVNSVASGNIRCNDTFILFDSGGGITAATVAQTTGSDVTVETFVSGST